MCESVTLGKVLETGGSGNREGEEGSCVAGDSLEDGEAEGNREALTDDGDRPCTVSRGFTEVNINGQNITRQNHCLSS